MGDFGQLIRLRRIEKGLSQRKLAKEAGLSSGAVSMIERGQRVDIRHDTYLRICQVLDLADTPDPDPALAPA